ncbi:MAG TPA: GNAT family N-acetyltransferase [Chryseosolibacter sp.]|nr:GNAT family N-acetyltransferase [Chryseosolibacter sp.]
MITFRLARADDLVDIVRIYNSTIPSRMVTADTEPVTVESRVAWLEKHTPQRPIWVVDLDGRTAGWVALHAFYGRPAYATTAEISIYLDERFRGKGLGGRVLDVAITQAGALGVKTLLGYIFSHNEISVRLFRSRGFMEWGTLPNVAVLDGIERSLKIFGKRILG